MDTDQQALDRQREYLERKKREIERFMEDTIKVYNPTDEDFYLTINTSNKFLVPNRNHDTGYGKGCALMRRGYAYNYYTHMTDKIINDTVGRKIKEENERRSKNKQPEMNKWQEQFDFESRERAALSREEIMAQLFVEVVEEFGVVKGKLPEVEQPMRRNTDDSLFERIEQMRIVKGKPKVEEVLQ